MIRVLRRQLGEGAGTLVVLALVTAALVALTVGWPRALDRLLREDLVARAEAVPVTQRDLTLSVPRQVAVPFGASAEEALADLDTASRWVEDQVADVGPALAAVLGEPQHEVTRPPFFIDLGPRSSGVSFMTLTLSLGPRQQDLRLVEGSLPAAPDVPGWFDAAADGTRPLLDLDVVVTPGTASWLGWEVGETRSSRDPAFAPFRLRLSGLVEAADPGSTVWEHLPGVLEPAIDRDDSAGWTVHGVGWVHPAAGAMPAQQALRLTAWYPVDAAAVGEVDRDELAAELAGVRAASGLRSELAPVLATADGRERTVRTLLDVLVAGLVGVAAGVLWLASVLAVERRRTALVLLRARGASSSRLAALVGAQALLAVLPGAAVGGWLGLRVAGRTEPADLVLPTVLVLAAVGLVVVAAARVHGGRRGPRPRRTWVVELLVVGLTVAALTAVTTSDPLVTVLPVAVGLSAALVARRVHGWQAGLALRALARRRDLGAFLGAAGTARAPAAGLVPVLALTLGVSTAALGATATTTLTAATERSAAAQVGADLRLDLAWSGGGQGLSEEQVTAAREVPGVAALATVADARTVTLLQERTRATVDVRVVDGDALADVQRALPGGVTAAGSLAAGSDRVLVADDVAVGDVTLEAPDGPVALTAVAADAVPGVTSGAGWLLVDPTVWAEAGGRPPVDRLLVRLEPGAEPDDVAAGITEATGARLTVTTRADAVASITEGVLVTGVRSVMLLVAGASLALVAALLALVLVAGAPARGRAAAILATLGAPPAVRRHLVVAEALGPVVVGGLAGVGAGLVLPTAVLRVADLRPFTGAAERPPVVVDPGLLLAGGAGLAVVLAVAVGVAVVAARRVSPVGVLREGAGG